jgi:hypothetical protein
MRGNLGAYVLLSSISVHQLSDGVQLRLLWTLFSLHKADTGLIMGALMSFLAIYLFGGLTFFPLLTIAVIIHAYFTFPVHDVTANSTERNTLLRPGDSSNAITAGSKVVDEKFHPGGNHDPEEAAGYFAVCREYVPGGVNGKPPERTTPTGSTVISSPSPSVYQSMYRSIFDRKPTISPLDNKGVGKPQRKGGNIFYVVLR